MTAGTALCVKYVIIKQTKTVRAEADKTNKHLYDNVNSGPSHYKTSSSTIHAVVPRHYCLFQLNSAFSTPLTSEVPKPYASKSEFNYRHYAPNKPPYVLHPFMSKIMYLFTVR